MPTRSQRHLREIQGIDSAGDFYGGVGQMEGSSLDFDFVDQFYFGGSLASLSVTRAGNAYSVNSGGGYLPVPANQPRISDLGLLIEEARTNSIRNNSMQGAVIGAPGTLPTNWSASLTSSIVSEVVALGTENGIDYIDLKLSGTPSGSTAQTLFFETSTGIAGLTAQAWAASIFLGLAAGSNANTSAWLFGFDEGTSGGTFVTAKTMTPAAPTLGSLSGKRVVHGVLTSGGGTVATLRPYLKFSVTSGQAINMTLRIGWPQMEQGPAGIAPTATTPIRTTSAVATRAADIILLTGTAFSSIWNNTQGTIYAEAQPISVAAAQPTRRWVEASDSTINERVMIGNHASNSGRLFVVDGGTTQVDSLTTNGSIIPNTVQRIAGAYQLNSSIVCLNGTLGTADTNCTMPTCNRLAFGSDVPAGATSFLDGFLRRVTFFPTRLPNATLQELTAA